jgi:hypothetical protein
MSCIERSKVWHLRWEAPVFDPVNGSADSVFVRGRPLPGICRIVGLTRKAKIDELMGRGIAGSFLVYNGRQLSRWQIEVTLGFIPQDYETWETEWMSLFKFPKGMIRDKDRSKEIAYDISHPALAAAGVKQFTIEEIKGPESLEHGNINKYSLSCIEFVPFPKIQTAKITSPAATPEDPGDKLVREANEGFKAAHADNANAWKFNP